MAEVKNSFLSAKMNQDLDDRLVPQNEYRHAKNISIVSSNNSNNGVIQNITGNKSIIDFGYYEGLEIIGQIADEVNNILYLFATSYTDTSFNGLNNQLPIQSQDEEQIYYCVIIRVDLDSSSGKVLVEGSFLNFSKTSPILNINLLEDLLFWTDNRNQPRKINVNTAFEKGITYYTKEDHISVAKYAPVNSIGFINSNLSTMKDVVSQFDPDGTTNPNYNANFIGDKTFLQDKFVRFSYRYKYDDNEYSILAPFSQIAFVPQQDGSFMGTSTDVENDENTAFRSSVVEFMKNKINQVGLILTFDTLRTDLFIDFKIKEIEIIYKESNSTTCYILDTIKTSNITYDINSIYRYAYTYESRKPKGVLPEDQLVRVYDKVPVRALTQETAGGRIIYANYIDKNTAPLTIDYRININKKSSTLTKELPLHNVKSNRNYQVGIVLSDRYGRQSDVILSPTNATDVLGGGGSASSFYVPWYNPTLDSNELTGGVLRFFGNCISIVFDTLLLQSTQDTRNPISSIDRNSTGIPGLYSPPSFAITARCDDDDANFGPGSMQRNFIVYDRVGFGETPVIAFEVIATMLIPSPGEYTIGSMIVTKSYRTVYVDSFDYFIINPTITNPNNNKVDVRVTSVTIPNPNGWYSYKIVVKQQQQEYYNVYAAGALAGYPTVTGTTAPTYPTGEESKTSNLILFSDNINKIPRDLSLVGPEQKQFRSTVQLFGRVQNLDIDNTYNQQFYPSINGFSVPNIQNILDVSYINNPSYYYQLQNGAIIARTDNNNVKFGATHVNLRPKLCILETNPVLSSLDIYWETSTAGLISDLNASISESNNPGVISFGDVGWNNQESQCSLGTSGLNDATGSKFTTWITDWFYPLDSNSKILTDAVVTLNSSSNISDLTGSLRKYIFELYKDPSLNRYRIKVTNSNSQTFYSNVLKNQFVLSLYTSVLINGVTINRYIDINGGLINNNPIIYIPGQTFQGAHGNIPIVMPPITAYRGITDIYQFRGENGSSYLESNSSYIKQVGLKWSFQDGTQVFNEGTGTTAVSLNISTNGFLKVAGGNPGIKVQPVIQLTDSGGAFALLTVDLDFTLGEFNQGEFTPEYNI